VPAGSDVYADFVNSLVDAETSRKSSLEQRGIAVITTSGTLVTLLFGLIAVITSSTTFVLPSQVHGWLAAAAILFVLAALTGIVVNVPLFYGGMVMTEDELRASWGDQPSDAQASVTGVRLKRLAQASKVNTIKAWILVFSVLLELAAVIILTIGIFEIIN
jgi:hypothetical protein